MTMQISGIKQRNITDILDVEMEGDTFCTVCFSLQSICIYFLVCRSSFYGSRLNSDFKKNLQVKKLQYSPSKRI